MRCPPTRERLASHSGFRDVHVDTFLAGSYRRRTARHPMKDVDVVVMLVNELQSWTPSDVLDLLDETLGTYDDYKRRRRGNRRSIQVMLPAVDMDVVPTVAPYGPDEELRIPDREVKQWMRTHPKGHIAWVHDLNGATTKIGSRGTLVPLVKLVKQWKATRFDTARHPKGFVLELLAGRLHDPAADRWDRVFIGFLENFLKLYAGWKESGLVPTISDPALPGEYIRTGMTASDFHRLVGQAEESLAIATKAREFESNGEDGAAAILWQKLFGKGYPTPDADSRESPTVSASDGAYIASVFNRPNIRQAPSFG